MELFQIWHWVFLTFVILATFSWTYIQTSEDIPAGESNMTTKEIKVKPSNSEMLLTQPSIAKIITNRLSMSFT